MLSPEQENIVRSLVAAFKENRLLKKIMFIGSTSEYFYEKSALLPASYRFAARTVDIDLCVKNVYTAQTPTNFAQMLADYGFEREVDRITGAVKYRYGDSDIEFLTPRRGDGRDPYPYIPGLGLRATEIKYMEILTHNTVFIDYPLNDEKISIQVPHPAAYALHKMVYNKERRNPVKRLKDIEAIERVTSAILDSLSLRDSLSQIYDSLTQKQRRLVLEFLKCHDGRIYGINAVKYEKFALHNKEENVRPATGFKPETGCSLDHETKPSSVWEIPESWDR